MREHRSGARYVRFGSRPRNLSTRLVRGERGGHGDGDARDQHQQRDVRQPHPGVHGERAMRRRWHSQRRRLQRDLHHGGDRMDLSARGRRVRSDLRRQHAAWSRGLRRRQHERRRRVQRDLHRDRDGLQLPAGRGNVHGELRRRDHPRRGDVRRREPNRRRRLRRELHRRSRTHTISGACKSTDGLVP